MSINNIIRDIGEGAKAKVCIKSQISYTQKTFQIKSRSFDSILKLRNEIGSNVLYGHEMVFFHPKSKQMLLLKKGRKLNQFAEFV